MTRILLDTQCWLWMLVSPERFSTRSLDLVQNPEAELLLSAASSWEIAIKYALGKLKLPMPPSQYVPDRIASSGVIPLPVEHGDALHVGALPPHHRDPFDRLLIAQAQTKGLVILTADHQFGVYDVAVHWAT